MPANFGLGDSLEVARAVHMGEIPPIRLGELAPVVLAACDENVVAKEIVHRLTDEVVAFAVALLGLDGLGADALARARARSELDAAAAVRSAAVAVDRLG